MKSTVSFSDFCDGFSGGYKDNFSHDAKRALFDYFEEMEEDCGIEVEFDPIAICCEYSEYNSAVECISDCGYDFTPEPLECPCCSETLTPEAYVCEECGENGKSLEVAKEIWEEEQEEPALEYLRYNTQVITFPGGIIIQDF